MDVEGAISASGEMLRAGDLLGAAEALQGHAGDRLADLQSALVHATSVFFLNTSLDMLEATVAAHIDDPRALDLLGLGAFYAQSWHAAPVLSDALNQCTAASRSRFTDACWQADNQLHIGMIQQAMGYHDLAEIYLRQAYGAADSCPEVGASAARRLGFDALARGVEEAALELFETSLALRREAGLTLYLPFSLISVAEHLEDPGAAARLASEAVDTARVVGLERSLAVALYGAGKVLGDRSLVVESNERAQAIGLQELVEATMALLRSMG